MKSTKSHPPPIRRYCVTQSASKEWRYVRQLDTKLCHLADLVTIVITTTVDKTNLRSA